MNGRELVRINDNLKEDRALWDSQWQEIADNMVYRKASIVGKMSPGVKLTQKMFDSTATLAGQDLAAWINGNMTGRGMNWFSLKKSGETEDNKDFQEWLESARKLQLAAFRESNRDSEWNEVLLDLTFFNTGAYYIEENKVVKPGFNGFNYIALPPGTYCGILGRSRRLQGMFREYDLKPQQAIDEWGENKVSDEIKKDAVKNPSKPYTFLHACFPKEWYGGKNKTPHPFVSYQVCCKTKKIMNTGGYPDFPFFMIPWLRESGETYGRGPGWTSLPDVKTIHKASELALKEWAMAIYPPLTMVDQGVIGSLRLTPMGVTVVKKDGDLKPLLTGANFSENRLKKEDLKAAIRAVFHGDKVQFIPPREQTGQMTAYEVARRHQMAQMLLGTTYGNIIDHGLDPEVELGFNMMYRSGAFGDAPIDIETENMEIVYESPIVRAQRVTEVEAISNTLEAVGQIYQVKEDIFDNFKLDDTALRIGDNLGYPTVLTNSKEERDTIRKATAEAKQKQEALEQAALLAKAGKDAAGAAKDMPAEVMEALNA